MTTAINSAISPFAQPKTEPNANAIRFLDEKPASVPASDIPEDFQLSADRRFEWIIGESPALEALLEQVEISEA